MTADGSDKEEEQPEVEEPTLEECVDMNTFEQILEMDDAEDENEFSRSIVYDFFQQAETTFTEMERSLEARNVIKISELGHFLKGSSATLGLTKVMHSCEAIQNLGQKTDERLAEAITEDECLDLLRPTIARAKREFEDAEKALRKFYERD